MAKTTAVNSSSPDGQGARRVPPSGQGAARSASARPEEPGCGQFALSWPAVLLGTGQAVKCGLGSPLVNVLCGLVMCAIRVRIFMR